MFKVTGLGLYAAVCAFDVKHQQCMSVCMISCTVQQACALSAAPEVRVILGFKQQIYTKSWQLWQAVVPAACWVLKGTFVVCRCGPTTEPPLRWRP